MVQAYMLLYFMTIYDGHQDKSYLEKAQALDPQAGFHSIPFIYDLGKGPKVEQPTKSEIKHERIIGQGKNDVLHVIERMIDDL